MSRPTRRARNPRGEGARLRQDIVQAATELLDAGGSAESVSLRSVANRIGISTPSIYPHFASREAILHAVVQEAFAELRNQIREALEQAGADPGARLRALCATYLEFAVTRPQRYRILFGGFWHAEDLQPVPLAAGEEVVGQDVFTLLVDVLRECVEAGRSASVDPAGDAAVLWAGLHGLAGLRTAAPQFAWPEDALDRVLTRLALLRWPATEAMDLRGPEPPQDWAASGK
ncbi:TetR/AcrR family transcriptional regulator [Deinococcus aestuarii]|uniref:TetR/AcrR family transcriptional regulator n=1 Tax=Deinococcus aestuarii TaxID=2774531 RepID=UPI001C0E8796|nr:TetR/AcrR family transcriptional regulator [Deinococcus aestuarii]